MHARDEKQLQRIAYSTDRVVMLQDYYHELSSGLLRTTLSPGSESDPIPDGALINGAFVSELRTNVFLRAHISQGSTLENAVCHRIGFVTTLQQLCQYLN